MKHSPPRRSPSPKQRADPRLVRHRDPVAHDLVVERHGPFWVADAELGKHRELAPCRSRLGEHVDVAGEVRVEVTLVAGDRRQQDPHDR